MDCSPPGFSVLGVSEARILEWVAIPSPQDLPDPGTEPGSPALQADSLLSEPPRKPNIYMYICSLAFWKNHLSLRNELVTIVKVKMLLFLEKETFQISHLNSHLKNLEKDPNKSK